MSYECFTKMLKQHNTEFTAKKINVTALAPFSYEIKCFSYKANWHKDVLSSQSLSLNITVSSQQHQINCVHVY